MYENGGTEYQRCQAGAAAAERCKKHKILRKLLPVCLILFIGLTLVKNRFLFVSISEYGFGDPATQGGLLGLIGGLMLSVIFAGAILGFYYMLVYKKLMTSFVSISKQICVGHSPTTAGFFRTALQCRRRPFL